MIQLNPYEKSILTVLLKSNRWLNTTEIAKKSKMSWNTALKYLDKIYSRGWLSKKGNYWKARK